jgi:ubiquinone/menaquinone biosynthesis C-methylase UbiE
MKLNVGCGKRILSGYCNIDIFDRPTFSQDNQYLQGDIRDLPFLDDSIDEIIADNVLEHLFFEAAYEALWELHRILKENHFIHIAVPDFEHWCVHFNEVKKDMLAVTDMTYSILCPVRVGSMSSHRSLWWRDLLEEAMKRIGFGQFKTTNKDGQLSCQAVKKQKHILGSV